MKFTVSIFSPIAAREPRTPEKAVTRVDVYEIEVAQPLGWVKQNADELATKLLPGVSYTALNVEVAL